MHNRNISVTGQEKGAGEAYYPYKNAVKKESDNCVSSRANSKIAGMHKCTKWHA